MSKKEVELYLTNEERRAEATIYANEKGVLTGVTHNYSTWFIRTTGGVPWNVGVYISSGAWSQYSTGEYKGLRPAVWVELKYVD